MRTDHSRSPVAPGTGLVADPVFVLCNGRSGPTLLRFVLDAHPDLACPPETNLSRVDPDRPLQSTNTGSATNPVPRATGDLEWSVCIRFLLRPPHQHQYGLGGPARVRHLALAAPGLSMPNLPAMSQYLW